MHWMMSPACSSTRVSGMRASGRRPVKSSLDGLSAMFDLLGTLPYQGTMAN